MKRFFTAIASALGLSVAAGAETKTVDPKTVYFSLATINDALPPAPNDEERGQPSFPMQTSLARSSSSVSLAFGKIEQRGAF